MSWLSLSLLLPIFSSVFSLSSKILLQDVQPISYTAYILLISGIMTIAYNIFTKKKMTFDIWGIISGFAFGLSTFGFEKALSQGKNPGMVNAVYRTQTVLTAILSVFLLGSRLTPLSIGGILLALAGAITIAIDSKSIEKFTGKNNDEKSDSGTEEKTDSSWIKWAMGAGLLLTVKDITAVKALRSGSTPYSYVVSELLSGALILFAYKFFKQGTVKLQISKDKKMMPVLAGMGLVSIDNMLWSLLLVYLMGKAPNPAYPKAITLLSVVLSAFLSKFLFPGTALDLQQWVGVFMVLGGVGTMIFANIL
jgi:drug/metabolite transporter (DMT)-like permease